MARQIRWVRAYVIHARTQDGVVDYVDFFSRIFTLPQSALRIQIHRELVIAVNRVLIQGGIITVRFASGNPEEVPLLYNDETGELAIATTPDGTWLASATHVAIVPESRVIIVEGTRRGVGATNLERYFSKVVRERGLMDRVTLDISPLPSPSFEEELDRFTRIREAVIEVGRPNFDWDDNNDMLSELAADSGGQKAQVAVVAAKGQSLEKVGGIIQVIREHVSNGLANIRNVKIFGRKEDDRADSSLTLEKHQLQATVDVEATLARDVEDEIVFAAEIELAERAQALIRERGERSEAER
ncbi:hypothetical protein [Dactylosporangium sp. CA-233914]|uniref:hypothetical protein n=1 Tax=Dactylosporangium sp. CA-233914 TaxID=3239934 RepID=UPI003D8BF1C5